MTFGLVNNNIIDRVHIKDKLVCDHEVFANCKIAGEKEVPVSVETKPEEVQQPKDQSSSAAGAVTSILVYMVLIIALGIIILKRHKRRI